MAKTMKILAIGNSVSEDAMAYAYPILRELGYEDIRLGNLYIGGASLSVHIDQLEQGKSDYTYFKNTADAWEQTEHTDIVTGIEDETWDIVTIQQASYDSGNIETYNTDIERLLDLIQLHAKQARVFWHMTWAYQQDSNHSGFGFYQNNQIGMYQAILTAVKEVILPNPRISGVIPSGTAIQLVRNTPIGDTLTRDGFHLSFDKGRYIAALMWCRSITNLDVGSVQFCPNNVSQTDQQLVKEAVSQAAINPFGTLIQLTNLTKYYHKHARGILDVTLSIKEGEVFGFIGPNGAGKSTTVRTLLNLIFPTSGHASIDNLDIVKDSVDIRKFVGYIPSEINFYGDMIVRDFLRYAGSFHGEVDQQYVTELTEKLELDVSRKIEDLSFGNKKKVAIIQALMTRPKILILDEPTSGLDPLMQNVFFSLIEDERKRGVTVFFSSHILSEVQRICDRVGIIKEGRLIKVETIEDILETRAKKVRIVSSDTVPHNPNISDLKTVNNVHTFVYTGEIQTLLQLISAMDIVDITINEPTLEEIFMHYYEKEDRL